MFTGELTRETLALLAEKSSAEELRKDVDLLSEEQIIFLLHILDKDDGKTSAILHGLKKRTLLEAAGRMISVDQLGKYIRSQDPDSWKYSPLLAGFNPALFDELLNQLSSSQLESLRQIGATEPIQHHLTLLLHALNSQEIDRDRHIECFEKQVDQLEPEVLSRQAALDLIDTIHSYHRIFEKLIEKTNKALAIAWHTNRTDLIEGFNRIKDYAQKYLNHRIGNPREDSPSTGLYALLEKKLFTSMGDSEQILHGDEPAIEALACFSIWYLRDYWELGLLPGIDHPQDLDTLMDEEVQNDLFLRAQNQLLSKELASVEDFKKKIIFSRKSLKEYLETFLEE